MEIVTCPDHDCPAPAEVLDRWDFSSTDGPIEHIKTLCLHRHTLTVPTAWLTDTQVSAATGITQSEAAFLNAAFFDAAFFDAAFFDGDGKRSRGKS
jgi:hypothetical protein